MKLENRNIAIIAVAALLFLCCCMSSCVLVTTTSSLVTRLGSRERLQQEAPPIMVTSAVTATAVPAKTEGPHQRFTPTHTGLNPDASQGSSGPSAQAQKSTATPIAQATAASTGTLEAKTPEVLQNQAEMPPRDLRDLALRLKPGVTDIPIVVNATPPVHKTGDTAKFWISNNETQEHRQITAELRYITDHVYMWVEQGVDLDQAELKQSADRFESKTYPTNREFFGSEWTPGVDNDIHLTILHARGLGKSVAGYYSSADEFSQQVNPYSNEREMFYISADSKSAEPNTSFYDGSLAHEFQHMIHWNNDRNEESWVNEGMSELAGLLNGFDPGGADIAYSEHPDVQLTTWADPREGKGEHYGASYLFMTYFLERFGEELTKAVVASPKNGIAGFNDALAKAGRPERFDDVFADWLIANYLDQPDAVPRDHYGYSQIDPQQPVLAESYRDFPASAKAEVSQYGADYIELKGRGPLAIDFQGQQQVNLVDTQPKGTYSWWSNRGDDSDATLTRAFDLRGTSSATLTFSTWYDIEDGWDYAYVQASTDDGKHWQILPGRYTTDKNPVGNAFGVGWTGISGGGETPEWVEEKVDLTPFAGKEILLRFEYVTDDAVNEPGFLLDNIAVPELKYMDGGEAGPAGWQAAGWVLTDNILPQRWLVQLLEVGPDGIDVQQMDLGADGHGQLISHDLSNMKDAVLVISGLTPITTEAAPYTYTITATAR